MNVKKLYLCIKEKYELFSRCVLLHFASNVIGV